MSWLDDVWGIAVDVLGEIGIDVDTEADRIEVARKQDLAIYKEQQGQFLSQQKKDNVFRQRGAQLSEDEFNFGKAKWGKQFNLDKNQWLTRRRQIEIDNKRTGTDKLVGGMMNNAGMRQGSLNAILERARS